MLRPYGLRGHIVDSGPRAGPSSNGRTPDFGSGNGGSNPPGPTPFSLRIVSALREQLPHVVVAAADDVSDRVLLVRRSVVVGLGDPISDEIAQVVRPPVGRAAVHPWVKLTIVEVALELLPQRVLVPEPVLVRGVVDLRPGDHLTEEIRGSL